MNAFEKALYTSAGVFVIPALGFLAVFWATQITALGFLAYGFAVVSFGLGFFGLMARYGGR